MEAQKKSESNNVAGEITQMICCDGYIIQVPKQQMQKPKTAPRSSARLVECSHEVTVDLLLRAQTPPRTSQTSSQDKRPYQSTPHHPPNRRLAAIEFGMVESKYSLLPKQAAHDRNILTSTPPTTPQQRQEAQQRPIGARREGMPRGQGLRLQAGHRRPGPRERDLLKLRFRSIRFASIGSREGKKESRP